MTKMPIGPEPSIMSNNEPNVAHGEISYDPRGAQGYISEDVPVTPSSPATATLPEWEDPRVQIVYKLLCNDNLNTPPNPEEHWEGWVSRNIVAALFPSSAGIAIDREEIAKIIYDAFPFTPTFGCAQKPEWTPRGNSFNQIKALSAADRILAMPSECTLDDMPPGDVLDHEAAYDLFEALRDATAITWHEIAARHLAYHRTRGRAQPSAATERDPWGQVRNQPRDLVQPTQRKL